MATNGTHSHQETKTEQYPATSGPTDTVSGGASSTAELSKDEVGWYFVEQYYTTLSKSPEKLHLFYGKRSQFVSGLEAEVTPVSVGRSAIQERIKELNFQDCKVRISNVDSQASFDNIVIQVIGETSNKSSEPKKFVQTFVLAKQPTGYFVLNDIFRYINEEVEEEQVAQEETAAAPIVEDVEMPAQQPVEESTADLDVELVDNKLDEVAQTESATKAPETNGTTKESAAPEVEEPKEEVAPTPEVAQKQVEEEQVKEAEKPADPAPTPAPVKAAPAQPAAPPKPMSWASRAAAAVGSAVKPIVPALPKTSTPPAQTRAPPPSKPAAAPASTSAPVAEKNKENTPPADEWQTAGADHSKKQNRPQSIAGPPEDKGTMGYVRNVIEKVDADELKAALASHGQVVYFDVNRGKNCAFVEFATAEGYQAAAAANPHSVSGEQIYVEARRPKAGAYGGNGYAGGRGGINNRGGRGGFENRNNGPNGRGGFGGPNRGRGGAAGGPRGGRPSQATNA